MDKRSRSKTSYKRKVKKSSWVDIDFTNNKTENKRIKEKYGEDYKETEAYKNNKQQLDYLIDAEKNTNLDIARAKVKAWKNRQNKETATKHNQDPNSDRYYKVFDNNKDSLYLCKSNIATLKEEPRTDILFQDAGKVRERPEKILPVNLVFLDPPYHKDLILKSIEALSQNNWFAPGAFFILEMAKDENIIPQFTQIENEKIYGDTKVLLASLKP